MITFRILLSAKFFLPDLWDLGSIQCQLSALLQTQHDHGEVQTTCCQYQPLVLQLLWHPGLRLCCSAIQSAVYSRQEDPASSGTSGGSIYDSKVNLKEPV